MKKIDIVTGASSGMGVCFARQLARECECSEIWIVARRLEKLQETEQKILSDKKEFLEKQDKLQSVRKSRNAEKASESQKKFPEVKIVCLDISGKKGALEFKKILEEENEKTEGGIEISVLVNNAGFGTYGEFADTDTVREMYMIDIDCTALTGLTGFCLPYMKKNSRLIFTASLASFMPLGNFAVYGACKAYVLSFAVALAAELKPKGIKVTILCPGPVSTEFANVASKGARKEVRHGLSPEKTVEHCIKQSRKGRLYSLRFFKWKFKAAASTFVNRYLGAWFTFKFCKRPSN